MFEEGQVIELDNNKDYVIWKIKDEYIYLMTINKPIEIIITKYINDKFEVVKDKDKITALLENIR